MTDDQRMHMADRAGEVLNNEAFLAVCESLAEAYIEAWRKSKTIEAREDAHRYVNLCERFVSDLKAMVLDGQMTRKRVNELVGKKPLW